MEQIDGLGDEINDIDKLPVALQSSSTSRRKADLQALRARILDEKVSETGLEYSLNLLFQTYPKYRDRGSRRAVQDCLSTILSASSTCFNKFVQFLRSESSKTGIAPSNAFVLVEWFSLALQICAKKSELWKAHGLDLILPYALTVELCISSPTRDSIKKSAIVVTRRALRKLFTNSDFGEDAVRTVVSQLSEKSPLGYKSAVLLGIVAGVCYRLPSERPVFEGLKLQCISFWVRDIVGSRTIVPYHIATSLNDFFSSFIDINDLDAVVIPALEKALLRSPEVVLHDLARPLLLSLSSSIDLADILANHLMKPLLANIKSTNVEIRNGAISTFAVLVERSHDRQLLEKVSNEVLIPLSSSKLTTAEHRLLHARMLSMLPYIPSCSSHICDGLSSTVSKEPNEAALAAEVNTLTRHLRYRIVQENCKLETIISIFAKGLSDKRPAFQKIWALRSGDLLWHISKHSNNFTHQSSIAQVVDMLVPNLLALYDEVTSNSLPATHTGVVIAAHIVLSLYEFLATASQDPRIKNLLQRAKVYERALTTSPKLSYLLNPRIYTKMSNDEDIEWVVRALSSSSVGLCTTETSSAVTDAWSQAFIYFLAAKSVPSNLQKFAAQSLTEIYLKQPAPVGKNIIGGLWKWYRNVEDEVRDSAAFTAQTGTEKLHVAVRAICPVASRPSFEPPVKVETVRLQLIEMLVLCRPEILSRVSWIEVCLRTGQDPGDIAKLYSNECILHVTNILQGKALGSIGERVKLAAYNTLAELAFAAPITITPLLIGEIKTNLAANELRKYGPTEFAIARTPEGVAFVDVLSKKVQNQSLDKNVRDYDTLKWEQEVRSELAQMKGQDKKLTADEQAKVKAQLVKEAAIRDKVLQLEKMMQIGIGIIYGLATGPPTEASMWMGPSINSLLAVIEAGVGLLVGDSANEAFIACSNLLSSRLGSLRSFIGVATLRALGSQNIPQNLQQEPLGGKVTIKIL